MHTAIKIEDQLLLAIPTKKLMYITIATLSKFYPL